jgi:hypothetical protein
MLSHWTHLKSAVSDAAGLGRDLLHVPVGLAIFAALLWVFRGHRCAAPLALAGLAVAQGANEALDAAQWWSWTGQIPWREVIKDCMITLAFPAQITLAIWAWSRRGSDARNAPVKLS